MTIVLSQAITNVRSLLDEPASSSSPFWSDAEITTWLNEACADSQRRAEWKQLTQSIPVIPNTQNFSAPENVYRIHRVTFVPQGVPSGQSQNTYTLEYRGQMEMDQLWGINQQWPANYPMYYTLWGNPGTGTQQIIVYPVSSQAGNLIVYYYPNIIPVTATTAMLDTPQGFEDMVYDYAVYRAKRKDADPSWQDFKADYEAKLVSLIDSSRTYQDQANFVSTGQIALPGWLTGSDGGW